MRLPSEIYDPVRKKSVASTPEEVVRQAVLSHLIEKLRVPINLIGVEYSLSNILPGNLKKVDIVVWQPGAQVKNNTSLDPWLLVECKRPGIALNDKVTLQAAGYLAVIQCPYLWFTNGPENKCMKLDGRGYTSIPSIPFFK